MKKCSLIVSLLFTTLLSQAQELQAKVTVQSQKVYNNVDKKVFTTLQNQLTNFLNTRKWTSDAFSSSEKINCYFLLNIENMPEQNVYEATLTVQAARPIFNSSYQSPLINYKDASVAFKYVEFQPVEFNENRVQGNDPLAANLTAVFAYYAYMILGLDYDSFSPKGGATFFQKAQNIVNNAPEARSISGWRPFDDLRNRYWLAENMMNTKYNLLHDVIYTYYRSGLDNMYGDDAQARAGVFETINRVSAFNQENPNTMFVQFFLQGRASEFVGILKKASPADRKRYSDILQQIDISNSNFYKQELR
jgi:hypothetical protein